MIIIRSFVLFEIFLTVCLLVGSIWGYGFQDNLVGLDIHPLWRRQWENARGEIFYVEHNRKNIYSNSSNGIVETIKISGFNSSVSPEYPKDITGDNLGNLFYSVCETNRIYKLFPTFQRNIYTAELIAGTPEGDIGMTPDGAISKGNPLSCPWGIAFDTFRKDRIYFVERELCNIRAIYLNNAETHLRGTITTIAGQSRCLSSDLFHLNQYLPVPASEVALNNPHYLTLDPTTGDIEFNEMMWEKEYRISPETGLINALPSTHSAQLSNSHSSKPRKNIHLDIAITYITFIGVFTTEFTGNSVASGGDVNGDGIPDLLIGSCKYNSGTGRVFLIFGKRSMSNIFGNSLTSTQGVVYTGQTVGDSVGQSVALGDVNGDGKADMLIGAHTAASGAGKIYLVYGTNSPINLALSGLSSLQGVTMTGSATNDYAGFSVAIGGDFNGDSFNDMIIGAYGFNGGIGKVYLIYGGTAIPSSIPFSTNIQGNGWGITITGATPSTYLGSCVRLGGDVNGDNRPDLLLGAAGNTNTPGKVYLVFGSLTPTGVNLVSWATPSQGITITGEANLDSLGFSVAIGGDVNGDGRNDLLLGAYSYSGYIGRVYLIYGTASWTDLSLGSLPGSRGVTLYGLTGGDNIGYSVSIGGDVNGDGLADMLIGSPGYNAEMGTVYIVYGKSNLNSGILLPGIPYPQGYAINGAAAGYGVGASVSISPDIDGDGFAEQLVGAPGAAIAYLVYGDGLLAPTSQPSGKPSRQPTRQPSGQPTAQPRANPTSQPTNQPSGQPSSQPILRPTSRPTCQPSAQPTNRPTSQPSHVPSSQPSSVPSSLPTDQPTGHPSAQPISRPTSLPSQQPISRPSSQPSSQPTAVPSLDPSSNPSRQPSSQPISCPSEYPSSQPSHTPSVIPSGKPSLLPSTVPTSQPTCIPTGVPTDTPTCQPSSSPSGTPTSAPSIRPSGQPSSLPTTPPSRVPTEQPTSQPSGYPSGNPTSFPSVKPSGQPSIGPSAFPVALPSSPPTEKPSSQPSGLPSGSPTRLPSSLPSNKPSSQPISNPSTLSTDSPTSQPSRYPTPQPSSMPTILPTTLPTGEPSFSCPSISPSPPVSRSPLAIPTMTSIPPSFLPTFLPSMQPSVYPSTLPTVPSSSVPTVDDTTPTWSACPTALPTVGPSITPTLSMAPTCKPTSVLSSFPPTFIPSPSSSPPTDQPSDSPIASELTPTSEPTLQTLVPPMTVAPSTEPSSASSSSFSSSVFPSLHSTEVPTTTPLNSVDSTMMPATEPTIVPSSSTTNSPTIIATNSSFIPTSASPTTTIPSLVSTLRPSFAVTSSNQNFTINPKSHYKPLHLKGLLFLLGRNLPRNTYPEMIYWNSSFVGSSYLVFGSRNKYKNVNIIPAAASTAASASSSQYTKITAGGILQDTQTRSISSVGDVNGDSLDDYLVGDPLSSRCFLLTELELMSKFSKLVSTIYFDSREASTSRSFGWSVSGLGDLNDDGLSDMVISAPELKMIYILYGARNVPKELIVKNMNSSQGFSITGSTMNIETGVVVSSAGDFNNDGHTDLVFSTLDSWVQNAIYVLLRSGKPWTNIELDHLPVNSFFKIIAPKYSFAGISLSGVGDLNGDGFDDIVIGSIPYQGGYVTQKSYVVYGQPLSLHDNKNNTLYLSDMREGEDGFVITGGGFMVSGPGDVNGDGFADVMIVSYYGWAGRGNAYLLVHPVNISSSPTLVPSVSPSILPTNLPSSSPSTVFPSSLPTLSATSSSSPTALQNQSSSSSPTASRRPSHSPTTYRPTFVKSVKPSQTKVPSRPPTRIPTTARPSFLPSFERKTISPSTPVPSRIPTTHQPTPTLAPGDFPTSFPSITSNNDNDMNNDRMQRDQYEIITVGRAGNYSGSAGRNTWFIINLKDEGLNQDIRINLRGNGGGRKIYTVYPFNENNPKTRIVERITIEHFNVRLDNLDLTQFPLDQFTSMQDLSFTTDPLVVYLSDSQVISFPGYSRWNLEEKNFEFTKIDSFSSSSTSLKKIRSPITDGIVLGTLGAFVLFVMLTIFCGYLNSREVEKMKKIETKFLDSSDNEDEMENDPQTKVASHPYNNNNDNQKNTNKDNNKNSGDDDDDDDIEMNRSNSSDTAFDMSVMSSPRISGKNYWNNDSSNKNPSWSPARSLKIKKELLSPSHKSNSSEKDVNDSNTSSRSSSSSSSSGASKQSDRQPVSSSDSDSSSASSTPSTSYSVTKNDAQVDNDEDNSSSAFSSKENSEEDSFTILSS
jgi:hypothetical protein